MSIDLRVTSIGGPTLDRAFTAAGLGHRLRWLPRGVQTAGDTARAGT